MSQTPGWQPPGGSDQPGTPGPVPAQGWQQPGQPAGPPPYGSQPPPYGSQPPPYDPTQPYGAPGWGWQQQPVDVKPGVVPLRPLGVGELLDGAVSTLRQNPGAMLGLSAAVAVLTQVLSGVVSFVFFRDVLTQSQGTGGFGARTTTFEDLSGAVSGVGAGLVAAVIAWLATVLLTGMLTVVVSRAVVGERMDAGQAWRATRPRLLGLLGLTLLIGLTLLVPVVVVVALSVAAYAAAGSGAAIAVGVLGGLAALAAIVFLYVRFAIATPAYMLETVQARRSTVRGAIARSYRLVGGAWWRTLGVLLLAAIITSFITFALGVPGGLLAQLFTSGTGEPGIGYFLVTGISAAVAATITAPFSAALTVLLYVDRRIRREGLDIELARAANVTIPGRTTA